MYALRVVSPDRQPVAAAEVSWLGNPSRIERTDTDGHCSLAVPAGKDLYLLRVAAGVRHVQATWQPPSPEPLTITLPWAGPLHGVVVDADSGAPIAGVGVLHPHSCCRECVADAATTAADGSFTMPSIARDRDEVFTFDVAGYPKQHDQRRFVGRDEPVGCTFRLRVGVAVRGRFVDATDRTPVADVAITHQGSELCRSAADGAFAVRLVPDADGRIHFEATHAGHCRQQWSTVATAAPADFVLLRTTALTGTVRSTTGAPIAQASVLALRANYEPIAGHPADCRVDGGDSMARTKADADGHFELRGLVPDAPYMVRATHAAFEPGQWHNTTLTPDLPAVTLELTPKANAAGTGVLTGSYRLNGRPSSGALGWRAGERHGDAWISHEGRFRLQGLPAGAITLTVWAERFRGDGAPPDAVAAHRTVQLGDGEEMQIQIEQELDEVPIAGRVVRTDGEPVANQGVWARSDHLRTGARTGDDGTYTLPVPRAFEAVTVGIDADAEPPQRDVAPGATEVDFVLPKCGTLRYRVTLADHRTHPQLLLVKDGEQRVRDHEPFEAPDPDGYRTLTAPRGDYTVFVLQRGAPPARRRVTLGEHATLDVALASGVTVTLRLASDAADPGDLRVRIVDECFAEHPAAATSLQPFGLAPTARLQHAGADVRHVGPGHHRLVAVDRDDVELDPAAIDVGERDATFDVRWRKRAK